MIVLSCCPSPPLNQHASAGNPLKSFRHFSLIARSRLGVPKEHKKYQQQALERKLAVQRSHQREPEGWFTRRLSKTSDFARVGLVEMGALDSNGGERVVPVVPVERV